jgi:hypothetical protein
MRRWLLVIIVLLGFGLRVYHLDHFGFWQDEGLTPLRAGYSIGEILSNRITIQEGVTQDTHPPLYFLIIHLTRRLFGESDFAYRFPATLAGVLLIPLIYQFGRRLHRPLTGFVSAGLVSINPFYIWYAQEARMYTLTALLGAAAAYAMWRALTGGRTQKWFALYALFAGLAFLTHYTVAILIAAQIPLWLWLLWKRGRRRLILVGGLVGLLLLIPFIPFTVPRLFTGAETNYNYVSPLIMLQDVVHGFTMGWTADFERLSVRLLDVAVGAVLLAGVIGPWGPRHGRLPRVFLLVYLLAVVAGLAAGSLIKPMYQGARHIIAGSPAFSLLLALGVATLARRRPLGYAALGAVLVAPALSLLNLYFDPQYAKDDVRALIQYVEMMAGDHDVVVYNNAILLGLHWHYAQRPDLPVTALPVYPYPAGEETTLRLQMLAQEYDRLWLINDPPADRRDDGGLVQAWLQANLVRVDSHNEHARTIQVRAEAYDARPALLPEPPLEARRLDLRWPEMPRLLGWRPPAEEPYALPTLWLELFWSGDEPVAGDVHLRFALAGPDGQRWLDESRPFWPEGRQLPAGEAWLRLTYPLTIPTGTPPGDYDLMVLPWLGASGAPLGDWQQVGPLTLASGRGPGQAKLSLDTGASLRFRNGLVLLGLENTAVPVRPGHTLPLIAYWQALEAAASPSYELQLLGPGGQVWSARRSSPGPSWLAPGQWPEGAPVRELIGLAIPADAPPGTYRLLWRMSGDQGDVPVRPAWRPWYSGSARLGAVTVEAWPMETHPPAPGRLVEGDFGPAIRLYGYDLATEALVPGRPLALTLYWLARQAPQDEYYVFVHLVAAADETIVSQIDRIPVEWLRPTRGWRPGEYLRDPYELPVPAELPAGTYHLYVGLFDPDSFARPAVTMIGQEQPGNRLLLETLVVP